MTLAEFKEKLEEYATNDVSAFMGKVKVTQWERDDLHEMFKKLSPTEQTEAAKLLKARGVDAP